ncbi:hypothetical protein K9M48_00115 [Candidatus Gracilibacteria bacterium]|nr:hypothetical protein [Candidatus Gracilibacteria bacterium]
MNTFGLIFEIIFIIRTNDKVKDEDIKEMNKEELKKDIAKLMLFIGIVFLCFHLLLVHSYPLMIISIILIVFAILGRLANSMKCILDDLVGGKHIVSWFLLVHFF